MSEGDRATARGVAERSPRARELRRRIMVSCVHCAVQEDGGETAQKEGDGEKK